MSTSLTQRTIQALRHPMAGMMPADVLRLLVDFARTTDALQERVERADREAQQMRELRAAILPGLISLLPALPTDVRAAMEPFLQHVNTTEGTESQWTPSNLNS